jgi:hypothetical protein
VKLRGLGRLNLLKSCNPKLPQSVLITYDAPLDNDGNRLESFDDYRVTFASAAVEENVAFEHINYFWKLFVGTDRAGYMFGPFLRRLFVDSLENCIVLDKGREYTSSEDIVAMPVKIPCCTSIQLVVDPVVELAFTEPFILLHSTDPNYTLIDFLFKDDTNNVHAIHATVGKAHNSKRTLITEFLRKLGTGYSSVTLYYLVPTEVFEEFQTNPLNPKYPLQTEAMPTAEAESTPSDNIEVDDEMEFSCRILHAAVPNPEDYMRSQQLGPDGGLWLRSQ